MDFELFVLSPLEQEDVFQIDEFRLTIDPCHLKIKSL